MRFGVWPGTDNGVPNPYWTRRKRMPESGVTTGSDGTLASLEAFAGTILVLRGLEVHENKATEAATTIVATDNVLVFIHAPRERRQPTEHLPPWSDAANGRA
jgi:hypothetical protein